MPDKFHPQLRRALCIPVLFKREDAQEQIVIRRQQIRAARTRRPDLRRDELHDFGIPPGKRIVADVFPDRMAEAQRYLTKAADLAPKNAACKFGLGLVVLTRWVCS